MPRRKRNTKRGKGGGSVFELPNGTWRGKVTVGHADPSFTLKRYAHVLDDHRRTAAITLSQLLSSRGQAN